jgi:hypothetical protein
LGSQETLILKQKRRTKSKGHLPVNSFHESEARELEAAVEEEKLVSGITQIHLHTQT